MNFSASWTWRLLLCVVALLAVLALLWYVRVIVLPTMVALTIIGTFFRGPNWRWIWPWTG